LSENDHVYLQDRLTGWRRATALEAAYIFSRFFTVLSLIFVATSAIWNGKADFEAAFVYSLIASSVLGVASICIKNIPVFKE